MSWGMCCSGGTVCVRCSVQVWCSCPSSSTTSLMIQVTIHSIHSVIFTLLSQCVFDKNLDLFLKKVIYEILDINIRLFSISSLYHTLEQYIPWYRSFSPCDFEWRNRGRIYCSMITLCDNTCYHTFDQYHLWYGSFWSNNTKIWSDDTGEEIEK